MAWRSPHGDVWLHYVTQLGHDGEHAREVRGTRGSLERGRHRSWIEPDRRCRGVHRRAVGDEQACHLTGLRQVAIAIEVTRVAREILGGPELQRVHEDAHHHDIGELAGAFHQAEMAVVESAHGGHEADA